MSGTDPPPPRPPQDTIAVIDAAEAGTKSGNRFGTFSGVFTPSILTILGVVMYLRFGWVVGNVGLGGALLIVVIAHLITTSTGLSIHLLRGTVAENAGIRRELLDELDHRVAQAFPNVFYRVDVVDDIYGGAVSTAQSYGLGNFEANTVMLGWPKDGSRFDGYAGMLRDLVALERSLFIVNYQPERGFGHYRNIHIWWGGLQSNGGLMLLLAFLLMGDEHWKNANASLLVAVDTEEAKVAVEEKIRRVLSSVRLDATPIVLLRNGRDVREIMREQSLGADLAIIGVRLPGADEPVGPYYERMSGLLDNLPTTILVRSALTFSSEPVLLSP